MNLIDLPLKIQQIIFNFVLLDSSHQPLLDLFLISKQLNKSINSCLFNSFSLQDDDNLILAAEQSTAANRLAKLYHSQPLLSLVHHLTISAPTNPAPGHDYLNNQSLLLFLSKLLNLSSFTWNSSRLPPATLNLALGTAARHLTKFKLNLQPLPAQHQVQQLRWDSPSLSALPVTLLTLSLSHLSLQGARQLSTALSSDSLPFLESIALSATLFVDDHLLQNIGIGCGRRLKILEVREMGGTRFTEKGLSCLMEDCIVLESLILDCVEGT